jgi:hypothetical protein
MMPPPPPGGGGSTAASADDNGPVDGDDDGDDGGANNETGGSGPVPPRDPFARMDSGGGSMDAHLARVDTSEPATPAQQRQQPPLGDAPDGIHDHDDDDGDGDLLLQDPTQLMMGQTDNYDALPDPPMSSRAVDDDDLDAWERSATVDGGAAVQLVPGEGGQLYLTQGSITLDSPPPLSHAHAAGSSQRSTSSSIRGGQRRAGGVLRLPSMPAAVPGAVPTSQPQSQSQSQSRSLSQKPWQDPQDHDLRDPFGSASQARPPQQRVDAVTPDATDAGSRFSQATLPWGSQGTRGAAGGPLPPAVADFSQRRRDVRRSREGAAAATTSRAEQRTRQTLNLFDAAATGSQSQAARDRHAIDPQGGGGGGGGGCGGVGVGGGGAGGRGKRQRVERPPSTVLDTARGSTGPTASTSAAAAARGAVTDRPPAAARSGPSAAAAAAAAAVRIEGATIAEITRRRDILIAAASAVAPWSERDPPPIASQVFDAAAGEDGGDAAGVPGSQLSIGRSSSSSQESLESASSESDARVYQVDGVSLVNVEARELAAGRVVGAVDAVGTSGGAAGL